MTVIRRRLKAGELVNVHAEMDDIDDWSKSKGLAVVIDPDPDPERPGLIEIRYTKERPHLPIQTLINSFSCVRVK